MSSRRVLRRLSVAFAFGLLLAFVPVPGMRFQIQSAGASADLPGTGPMSPEAVAQAQTAADEPLTGDRVVATQAESAKFTAIGLTFDSPPTAPVLVRVKDGAGRYGPWRELATEGDEGPDRSSPEAGRSGTEPFWVGTGTGYEVSLAAPDAAAAAKVVTVRDVQTRSMVEATPLAGSAVPPPFGINPRSSWGARPPTETGYGTTVKLAVVHHTASSNAYSAAEVPGILRSIQAYHMDGRGWSDIGYNFLVDKYGGLWEGRGGGIDRPVIGAHAAGFNTDSVGVSVIGDYTQVQPTAASLESVSRVIGWKLFLFGTSPTGRVDYTSGGSSSIPAGVTVNLPVVVGHQDVGATADPGYIAPMLPSIRNRAQDWFNFVRVTSVPVGSVDAVGVGPGYVTAVGWAADPDATAPVQVRLDVGGVSAIAPVGGARPDVLAQVPFAGPNSGFQVTAYGVPPGYQDMCVSALNQNSGPGDVRLLCRPVTVADPTGQAVTGAIEYWTSFVGKLVIAGSITGPVRNGASIVGIEVDGVVRKWILPDVNDDFSNDVVGVTGGTHRVCVIGRSVLNGADTRFDCRLVDVPGASAIGSVDTIAATDGAIGVSGWALDLEAVDPIIVAIVVDGRRNSFLANVTRPDVAAVYPGYGPNHGFAATFPVAKGSHSVCVEFGGVGAGPNVVARCQWVVVK